MIPTYVLYNDMKILGTIWTFVLPALFGNGLNSAIFILIFYSFFKQVPKVLMEAAYIDGAGHFKAFFRIAIPSAVPAIITVFLFSFVWYWNETTQSAMYFGTKYTTLPLQLANLEARFTALFGKNDNPAVDTATRFNQSTSMAGTMLSILPLVIFYICLQRQFVESIDRTGIAGE